MAALGFEVAVEKEDDMRVYRLLANGKVVSTARTLDSILLTIGTVSGDRKKGYATRLLHHIEEEARHKGQRNFRRVRSFRPTTPPSASSGRTGTPSRPFQSKRDCWRVQSA